MGVSQKKECGGAVQPPWLAGESSVERVLDGGGVPLMRERAKEGTILAHIGGLLTFIYWILLNAWAGFLHLLCVVS